MHIRLNFIADIYIYMRPYPGNCPKSGYLCTNASTSCNFNFLFLHEKFDFSYFLRFNNKFIKNMQFNLKKIA